MNFATVETNGWQLLSAVERNQLHPSFWIPSEAERTSLQIGSLAQLLFEIHFSNTDDTEVERMWVSLRRVETWGYMGILLNQPSTLPENDSVYLTHGAEIPFTAEHIMEIRPATAEFENLEVFNRPTRIWS